jgi:hypothetical protein
MRASRSASRGDLGSDLRVLEPFTSGEEDDILPIGARPYGRDAHVRDFRKTVIRVLAPFV